MTDSRVIKELADTSQYMQRVDVQGDSGNKYRISIRKSDGRWCCSCRGWTNVCNKKGSDCKHIKRYKEALGLHFADGMDKGQISVVAFLNGMLGALKIDVLLSKWGEIKDKAFLMEDYLKMTEDTQAVTDYCSLLEQVKSKVIQAIAV